MPAAKAAESIHILQRWEFDQIKVLWKIWIYKKGLYLFIVLAVFEKLNNSVMMKIEAFEPGKVYKSLIINISSKLSALKLSEI